MSAVKRSSRRAERPGKRHGVLLVDKAAGPTSHDVVAAVRRLPGVVRAGHAGTLDPMATGLLVVCINEATKASRFLMERDKAYTARFLLGQETDTQDITGRVLREADCSGVTPERISREAEGLVGEVAQVPPMFSAVKRDGVRLHVHARAGREVDREPRTITIHSLRVEDVALPEIGVRVACSSGTYIRTLAAELGKRLGCGATLAALRRVRSGAFEVTRAHSLEAIRACGEEALSRHLIPLSEALTGWSPLPVGEPAAARAAHGQAPEAPPGSGDGERFMVLDPAGRLVSLAEARLERSGRMRLRTIRVFRNGP